MSCAPPPYNNSEGKVNYDQQNNPGPLNQKREVRAEAKAHSEAAVTLPRALRARSEAEVKAEATYDIKGPS
jgi:hypothetical protein